MHGLAAWQETRQGAGARAGIEVAAAAVEAIADPIAVVDAAGAVVYANRAWRDTPLGAAFDPTGADPATADSATADVPLLPWLESRPGPACGEVAAVIRAALAADPAAGGGTVTTVDWVVDGQLRRVDVTANRVPGEPRAAVVRLEDLSGKARQRQDQDADAEYSARLALVARHTNSGVTITDGDGLVEWVNEGFTQITGLGLDEVLGRPHREIFKGPFTRTPEFEEMFATVEAGRPLVGEYTFRAKGGRPYWVSIEALPVLEQGRVVRQIWVERDVTTRRRAEEHVRESVRRTRAMAEELARERTLLFNVLTTIPHLVFWKNTDLRYVGCNQAFLDFRGLTESAVLGRVEGELDVDDELVPLLAELEREVLRSGEAASGVKVTVTGADGSSRSLLLSVLPQAASWGETEGVIGVAADVTRVSELERQLAQATRLESIGQLAAGIAHEINTPVQYVNDNNRFVTDSFTDVLAGLERIQAALDGFAETGDAEGSAGQVVEVLAGLDLEFIGVEVPSALAQSAEGLERVTQIVRAMKDFSHPGQGRGETDLNRAIESTVQVSRSEWKYVAEVETELDPAVGLVSCYEGELKQVILNIVVNAAHAIGEQRERDGTERLGRIRLATHRDPEAIRIEIADDGPGMDPSVQERIFDPFFTTKGVGKGTGQGLSMAMNSIKKHGGALTVASAPGQGATFTITLPFDAALPEPGDAAATGQEQR